MITNVLSRFLWAITQITNYACKRSPSYSGRTAVDQHFTNDLTLRHKLILRKYYDILMTNLYNSYDNFKTYLNTKSYDHLYKLW